mgnify:CR=1 FL=1|jgi:Sugar phosphate isomerases/epimerases
MLPNNDLSFQLWTSRNFPPLEEQLRTLKSIGYTDVQPYHDQYNDPQAFKATLDEIGLTAKTGHFDINMIRSDFDRTVAAAKALGMKLVVAPFLKPDQRPTDRAGWETFGAELAGYAARYAEAGLDFAWHNHDFEFAALPDGSLPIEHVLGQTLLWEPDVAWIVRGGESPVAWLKRYAGRIPAVHVKDTVRAGENPEESDWADLGTGIVNWREAWDASIAAGSQLMIIEHDNPRDYVRVAKAGYNSAIALANHANGSGQ